MQRADFPICDRDHGRVRCCSQHDPGRFGAAFPKLPGSWPARVHGTPPWEGERSELRFSSKLQTSPREGPPELECRFPDRGHGFPIRGRCPWVPGDQENPGNFSDTCDFLKSPNIGTTGAAAAFGLVPQKFLARPPHPYFLLSIVLSSQPSPVQGRRTLARRCCSQHDPGRFGAAFPKLPGSWPARVHGTPPWEGERSELRFSSKLQTSPREGPPELECRFPDRGHGFPIRGRCPWVPGDQENPGNFSDTCDFLKSPNIGTTGAAAAFGLVPQKFLFTLWWLLLYLLHPLNNFCLS